MWTCLKCRENIEDQFDTCWHCGTKRDGSPPATPPPSFPTSEPAAPAAASGGGGAAFVKGGCGCLLVFVALAFIAVLFGGHAHADIGGLIMLFIVGGVIGLIIFAIYKKGRKDASDDGSSPKSGDKDA
jgi:predicted lipid-binding transport protein (Tim44 family)